MGTNGPGTRGTHDDSDGAGWPDKNMPAPSPKKQKDFTSSGKGGDHPSDFSGNSLLKPRELKPGVDQGGTQVITGHVKGGIDPNDHEPRRSHD